MVIVNQIELKNIITENTIRFPIESTPEKDFYLIWHLPKEEVKNYINNSMLTIETIIKSYEEEFIKELSSFLVSRLEGNLSP